MKPFDCAQDRLRGIQDARRGRSLDFIQATKLILSTQHPTPRTSVHSSELPHGRRVSVQCRPAYRTCSWTNSMIFSTARAEAGEADS